MQLTYSHHEFSLHHYTDTLQEQGNCDYRDAIDMHTLTETQIPDTHKPMHLLRCTDAYGEMLHYSTLEWVCEICSFTFKLFVALRH